MIRSRLHLRETIATLLADDNRHIAAARDAIISARQELEHYIAGDPFFLSTLEPCPVRSGITIVDRMAEAGCAAGVGPMAAVAGAIAWAGVEGMQEAGAVFGIVDNGGDIAILSDREVTIAVHAGASPLSDLLGFVVGPDPDIRGICTSSATVGPSISFGIADSVTVFSSNPAQADAWATAICNSITPDDTSIFGKLDPVRVEGVFVIIGSQAFRWGCLPEPVRVQDRRDLITGGLL
jgi:hypothetical protein